MYRSPIRIRIRITTRRARRTASHSRQWTQLPKGLATVWDTGYYV